MKFGEISPKIRKIKPTFYHPFPKWNWNWSQRNPGDIYIHCGKKSGQKPLYQTETWSRRNPGPGETSIISSWSCNHFPYCNTLLFLLTPGFVETKIPPVSTKCRAREKNNFFFLSRPAFRGDQVSTCYNGYLPEGTKEIIYALVHRAKSYLESV